jgi:hypothetical protein
MKLVCFPNQTAGSLVCDLLNNKTSNLIKGRVQSAEHNVLKIGDNGILVQKKFDKEKYFNKFNYYNSLSSSKGVYYGTHIHPNYIPNLNEFEEVVCITDNSLESKWYRTLRLYEMEFKPDTTFIKQLKDTFVDHKDCINIEFRDIVSGKFVIDKNLNVEHFDNWRQQNSYLYEYSNKYLLDEFKNIFGEFICPTIIK